MVVPRMQIIVVQEPPVSRLARLERRVMGHRAGSVLGPHVHELAQLSGPKGSELTNDVFSGFRFDLFSLKRAVASPGRHPPTLSEMI